MDDALLISALMQGDEAAFRQVLRANGDALFAFLARLSGDRELAQELLQQTWLALAESARRLDPRTPLRPWLFTVARNAYWSHVRWSRLDLTRLAELALWRREWVDVRSPEQQAGQSEAVRRVEQAVAKLSAKYREALLLISQGLDPAEAAAVVGVAPEAFRQRLSRGRAALDVLLGADHD